MTQGKRVEVSEAQRTDIWRGWKAGESLHEIGRAYGRTPSSIHWLLSHHGGIVPEIRRRSPQALTVAEREDISRGIASGSSMREIATRLCRATSTVSREVARHGGRSVYRASEADSGAWESARRPKLCLLAVHESLRRIVVSKLMLDWSPEQISGWLKIQYPKDENLRVSHETIYRSLFIQARGVLKKELIGHLRSKRRIRRSQHSSKSGHAMGQIVEAISIRERPARLLGQVTRPFGTFRLSRTAQTQVEAQRRCPSLVAKAFGGRVYGCMEREERSRLSALSGCGCDYILLNSARTKGR